MSEIICLRLKRGADLKREIVRLAEEHEIKCGCVLCAVGCVSSAKLRCADGKNVIEINEPCEIVSVLGTVSKQRCHIHVSLAKSDLSVAGGHLAEGCIINTTCELMILKTESFSIKKVFDEQTGYYEAFFAEE